MDGYQELRQIRRRAAAAGHTRWPKVPQIIVLFWVIKVLTTGMGETTSDYFVHRLGSAPAVALGGIVFAVALLAQFAVSRYRAGFYWTAVVMVSVFGTMCADVTHIGLGVPYVVSTTVFGIALIVVFFVWWRSEGTLSIHSIYTRRRETFYWLTVLVTFALGTAAGDMTATTLHLGYFSSALLFGGLMLIPLVGYAFFGMNAVLAFWFAYILTRPFGASLADWMAVSHARGGLAWGDGPVSIVLTVLIVIAVVYLAITKRDAPAMTSA